MPELYMARTKQTVRRHQSPGRTLTVLNPHRTVTIFILHIIHFDFRRYLSVPLQTNTNDKYIPVVGCGG